LNGRIWRDLVREYTAQTGASAQLYSELGQHLPGGQTRSVAHYEPHPVVLTDGSGALVHDLDGNEYIDVLNNYTSLVHGHAFAPVLSAVAATLPGGTVFPAPHPAQLRLAAMLTERYPAIERVRFTNSGTEAALLALRIARAATGRQRIVKFGGGYHGSVPELIDSGPCTIEVPYNDAERAVAAIDSSVAAVFAEPFLGSGGVITGTPEFLRAIEDRASATGCLFVLDEVQSLRNAVHGVHGALGLDPDLVLLGKIIGGGFPVGAVGGRATLLDLTIAGRPGSLPASGTFNGNVITMTAGAVSLSALDETSIARLTAGAQQVASEIESAAARADVPCAVSRAGSILQVHMLSELPDDPAAVDVPPILVSALHLALLLEGIYAAPRGMLNLSTALDDGQLERLTAGYASAFARVRDLVGTASDVSTTARPVTAGAGQ